MRIKKSYILGAACAAAAVASLLILPRANAELVYDEQRPAVEQGGTTPVVEDREATRKILNSSHKAEVTVQSNAMSQTAPTVPTAPVPAQPAAQQVVAPQVIYQAPPAVTPTPAAPAQVQVVPAPTTIITTPPVQQVIAPTAVETPVGGEVQNVSRSELMRRERMRQEVKNEDLLQERLEELRLRDERRRTDTLLTTSPSPAPSTVAPVAGGVEEEVVAAPVAPVQNSAKASPTPAAVQSPVSSQATVQNQGPVQDQVVLTSAGTMAATSTANAYTGPEDKTQVYVQPRLGLSNMSENGYDIKGNYTAGIGLGVGVTDNLTFELGYAYSEYDVSLNSSNPFTTGFGYYYPYNYNWSSQTAALKQNVVDANLKLYFLGPDSRFRPFMSGGVGYSKSYLNYDQATLDQLNRQGLTGYTKDYELSQFLGDVGGGFDIRLSKSISIGAAFKYYTVLSSKQSSNLNNWALAGPYNSGYYGAYYSNQVDADKQYAGGSLAKSSFYSVLAGCSFTF